MKYKNVKGDPFCVGSIHVLFAKEWEDESECTEINWKLTIKYNTCTSTLPWLLMNTYCKCYVCLFRILFSFPRFALASWFPGSCFRTSS